MAKLVTHGEAKKRRMRFQIFAGMFDFVALIAGVIVIIACVVLIGALINWLKADVPVTFKTMWEIAQKAIVIPE